MRQYLDLLQDVLDNGTVRDDRTGVGTISVFGRQIRFNMTDGFPAVTTKALAFRSVISELLWFLEGSTNEHRLAEIKKGNNFVSPNLRGADAKRSSPGELLPGEASRIGRDKFSGDSF